MSFKSKLKNKVLENSDSYNHYKKESEKLSGDIEKEIKKLQKEVKELKKSKKQTDKVLDSYNKLFNNIFLDYELKPKGAVKYTQELCLDLLDFVANICKKYGLEYWLDGGNALGAVRHKGYIPWDDDIDICMTRTDYVKFKEVIDEEIKLNELEGIVGYSFERYTKHSIVPFMNVTIMFPDAIYAAVDIFPMDFIINPPEDIEEKFIAQRKVYRDNLLNNKTREETLNEYYEALNCSLEKQEYILPSIEGTWGNNLKFKLFKSDDIFPLVDMEYEDRIYPCPHNIENYVINIYGENFRDIPKIVDFHQRIPQLKRKEGFEEEYMKYFSIMKKANENFKF